MTRPNDIHFAAGSQGLSVQGWIRKEAERVGTEEIKRRMAARIAGTLGREGMMPSYLTNEGSQYIPTDHFKWDGVPDHDDDHADPYFEESVLCDLPLHADEPSVDDLTEQYLTGHLHGDYTEEDAYRDAREGYQEEVA